MSGLQKMIIGLASPIVMLVLMLLIRLMPLLLQWRSANTATKPDTQAGAPAPTEANVRRIDVTHGRVEFGSVQEPLLHTSSSLREESIRNNEIFDVSEANGDALQGQGVDPQEEGGSVEGRSVDSMESSTSSEARDGRCEAHNEQHGRQPEQMHHQSDEDHSLLAAVSCLLLFTYTSFASQAIRLLNCVQVGDMHVLRYAGEQSCNFAGWQAPVVLLVAVLVLLPLIPVIRWLLNHRWARFQWLHPMHSFMDPFASRGKLSYAVVEYAAQPFLPASWHWASVLVLQRLLTAMCAALATIGVESSVTVALISLLFLLLHLLAQPYRSKWVNLLQGCANVCLVVLAILNSASGAFLSTGFNPHTDGSPTLQHFQTALEVLMLLTLFPTPLVYIWYMSASPNGRCCRSRGRERQRKQASSSFRAKSQRTVQGGQPLKASELDNEEKESINGELILNLQPQSQRAPMIEPENTRLRDRQWEKQELEHEKQQLEREKQVEGQRHADEKQQLEREKQQLEREKQQLEREKQQLEREKQQLEREKQQLELEKQVEGQRHADEKQQLEREKQQLEGEKQQLERAYPKMTNTKGSSSNRPLYRIFKPDPDAAR
jgi:hypothetical protein